VQRHSSSMGLDAARLAVTVFIALLVVLAIVQMDGIEGQLITLNGRLAAIDEKVQQQQHELTRLHKTIKKGALATSIVHATKQPVEAPERKWLHPEVDNFLEPDPFEFVVDDAQFGGSLTRWYGTDPKGLNPLLENGSDVREFVKAYVAETLADNHFENPDKWAPQLAERIEITDDYREYTVYLRKGVMWHTPSVDWGNPRYEWLKGEHECTAHDVKFALDLILNPQVEASHLRNYYQDIEYCKVLDRYTLVFRWKKKTYNSIAFTLGFAPLPKFIYAFDEDGEAFPEETLGLRFNEHWYNQRITGTGPYRFLSWQQGVSIKLTRNEEYWGQRQPIKDIVWLIFSDRKTNMLKLKSGELDYARMYPSDYREEIVNGTPDSPFKDGRIEHDFFIQIGYYYIGWNLTKPCFSDKRVRRAMSMCLDRKGIIKNIMNGLGVEATGPFFVTTPYCAPEIKGVPFDPDGARTLLAEAGWSDSDGDGILDRVVGGTKTPLSFTLLLYSGSSEWRALAALFKETLYKVGVRMDYVEVEWSLMQKRMHDRDFDAYSGGWGTSWDPDPYQIWHSSQADIPNSSNRIGFKNAEADQIIEELRNTFDKKKRIALCQRFHRIIHDEQPYTFFYSRRRVLGWWNHVERVVFKPARPQDTSLPWYIDLRN